MSAPRITLRACYGFFLPLVLMTELNMISKSVIHAFLARTEFPDVALAAFNTSFAFYFTIASATEVMSCAIGEFAAEAAVKLSWERRVRSAVSWKRRRS